MPNNHHLQPVPIGIRGELYIGGVGIPRGYRNRPNLTAPNFIQNQFSNSKGSRLYKTGDLAPYLRDGNIEFLGSIDNQVKIKSFRIEIGDIEATLLKHPQIREAVVIVREDIPGDKCLTAYLVTLEQLALSDLSSFLKTKVPDYMMPSAFVFLDAIPMTPHGTVARHALPAPNASTQEAGAIAPRNIFELQLDQIWSEVLKISSVGVGDNFFQLGGHSMLAVRLMASIKQQFGIYLPLTTLFTEPTIESQAILLSDATHGQPFSPVVPIEKAGNLPPFWCVHPGG